MSLIEADFEERLNRFLVRVRRDGRTALCHLPNPGRLLELLRPGVSVLLHPRPTRRRKTGYDLVAARKGSVWVSLDTRIANKFVGRWLQEGKLQDFQGYSEILPEVARGESRIDFLLRNGRECYLEVKSCSLVVDGVALFPDAPTTRGRRHVDTLSAAISEGFRAGVLFVVQRPDATSFRPHDERDPAFGSALREAAARGVKVIAYRSRFDEGGLVEPQRIQTDLGRR